MNGHLNFVESDDILLVKIILPPDSDRLMLCQSIYSKRRSVSSLGVGSTHREPKLDWPNLSLATINNDSSMLKSEMSEIRLSVPQNLAKHKMSINSPIRHKVKGSEICFISYIRLRLITREIII